MIGKHVAEIEGKTQRVLFEEYVTAMKIGAPLSLKHLQRTNQENPSIAYHCEKDKQ